jgi:predicted outer membrane repeat protein
MAIDTSQSQRAAAVSVLRCAFIDCSAGGDGGGAIAINGGGLLLQNSRFERCAAGEAAGGGALSVTNGVVTASRVRFDSCRAATGSGGAVAASAVSTLAFSACRFEGNSASAGGAINLETTAASARFSGCLFRDNAAAGKGGALAIDTPGLVPIAVSACIFDSNSALNGAAIAVDAFALTSLGVSRSTFTGNKAAAHGGALYFGELNLFMSSASCSGVTLASTAFANNSAVRGATAFFASRLSQLCDLRALCGAGGNCSFADAPADLVSVVPRFQFAPRRFHRLICFGLGSCRPLQALLWHCSSALSRAPPTARPRRSCGSTRALRLRSL